MIRRGCAAWGSIAVWLSFALLRASAAEPQVIRGPYLQIGTATGAIVRWRTDVPATSRVQFGTVMGQWTGAVEDSLSTTEHELTLTGLVPATKYFYSVGTVGGPGLADVNFFLVTSPIPGAASPTRIWVLGDAGTANQNQASVRDAYLNFAAATHSADLILMLGDNAYSTGTDAQYQAAVFDMYESVLWNTFLYSTIGNHDTAFEVNIQTFPYLDIFTLPASGEGGGLASGTERYYSYDYANIHFVCLDSQTSSKAVEGPMLTWLSADLAATSQEWIIAFWHHPPYSKGSHNSDTESQLVEMRMNALPILEAGGVDLVLCGHSHAYERSFFIRDHFGLSGAFGPANQVDAGDGRTEGTGAYTKPGAEGAVYTVAGSSGQISGGPLNHPAMFLSLNVLGSVVLDVEGPRLDALFLDNTGQERDHFTILKGPTENRPPVPANPTAIRDPASGLKVKVASLLGSDPDGDDIFLVSVDPTSAQAGVLALQGGWVFYTPPPAVMGLDTFEYEVVDSQGAGATGTVTVQLQSNVSEDWVLDDLGNGLVRVWFAGIPGRVYTIEFSEDPGSGVWQTLAEVNADALGRYSQTDDPAGQSRDYRSIATP